MSTMEATEAEASAGPPPGRKKSHRWLRLGPAALMLVPFVALFVIFLIWPLVNSLYFSFTEYRGIRNSPEWIGLENYRQLLFEDDRFRKALTNTFLYVLFSVSLTTILALVLAVAFPTTKLRDRVMRTVFFLPAVTSQIAVFLVWQWIFAVEDFGLANTIRDWLGMDATSWLTTPEFALPILVLMAVWGGAGYGMVLFVAGINAIPDELYEQARIDGASTWRQFWHITLPLLRPVTTYVVITSMIGAFQVFEAVYIVFSGSASTVGGTVDSALMIVPYLYNVGFGEFELGMASAIAWVLFFIIFIVSLVNLRLTRTLKDF